MRRYIALAERLRKIAFMVGDDYSGDSPFLNIPIYQDRIEPEEDSTEIGIGPQSLYEDPSEIREKRRKNDIRRQGPRPDPVDSLFNNIIPVTDTIHGNPKEDEQGKVKDTVTPDGRNENNDTIGFDPDELNVNPFRN